MMVQRLKSYFENPIVLRSFRNTLIGGAIVGIWAAGTLPWLVGILGAIIFLRIYFDMLDRVSVKWLFWILVSSYIIGVQYAENIAPFLAPGFFWVLFVISFLLLFFGVVGTGNFLFEDKVGVYGLTHTAVSFASIFFFGMLTISVSWIWSIPLFFGVMLISKEFFIFMKLPSEKESKIFGAVLALFSIEFVFLSVFLPLGFMNTAIFVALFLFILRNIIVLHTEKNLTKQVFFREIAVFVLFSLLIFATVRWTI